MQKRRKNKLLKAWLKKKVKFYKQLYKPLQAEKVKKYQTKEKA